MKRLQQEKKAVEEALADAHKTLAELKAAGNQEADAMKGAYEATVQELTARLNKIQTTETAIKKLRAAWLANWAASAVSPSKLDITRLLRGTSHPVDIHDVIGNTHATPATNPKQQPADGKEVAGQGATTKNPSAEGAIDSAVPPEDQSEPGSSK